MPEHRTLTDQVGRQLSFRYPPRRIVSLVPSWSETLVELGLQQQLVGITRWCIHPAEIMAYKTKVGGTKKVNPRTLAELQPDLIIGDKEEQTKPMIEELQPKYPIYLTEVETVEDGINSIRDLGEITGKPEPARQLADRIAAAWQNLPTVRYRQRVAYLIWKKPWMGVGSGTYIHDVLTRLGFVNVLADREARYPQFTLQELAECRPERVFFSSEPYPFTCQTMAEVVAMLPAAQLSLVDGEMFSWYGSRMQLASSYFSRLFRTA